MQTGDITANANVQLSATYAGASQSTTSNAWGVNLQDAGLTNFTWLGDTHPLVTSTGDYDWPLWALYFLSGHSSQSGDLHDGDTLAWDVAEPDFSDVIYGSTINDKIYGFGGNDALCGDYGNDMIDGGDGNDLIAGAEGSDSIWGGDGDDFIAGSGLLYVPQRSTNEIVWSPPSGQQVLAQGAGWGIYLEAPGGGTIWSHTYLFVIEDGGGDVIDGGAGNDKIIGGGGEDYIQGGTGNDSIHGLGGDDVLEGGEGNDYITADGLVDGRTDYTLQPFRPGADFVDGGAGDDTLLGGGDDDVIYGGLGNDRMWGDDRGVTSGADYLALTYHGNDFMDGEDGDDNLEGGGKDDTLYGGAGMDTLLGDTAATNVASPTDNTLIWGNDYLDGEDGNDHLIGGGKDDTLYGGTGDDYLMGDEGSSALAGEFNGNDYLDGGTGDDSMFGGGKDDILLGGAGNDTLRGDDDVSIVAAQFHGADYLDGGEGDDLLYGNGDSDVLIGGSGEDELHGGEGNDWLEGGTDADVLFGEGGNDTLVARSGEDWLDGGEGNDDYIISLNASTAAAVTIYDSGSDDQDVVRVESHRFSDISSVTHVPNGVWVAFADGTAIGIAEAMTGSISRYEFADGAMDWQAFISKYLQTPVTLSGDAVAGGKGDDGLAAYQSIRGGSGSDELFVAGATNILVAKGDGTDVVMAMNAERENRVSFLDGITNEDLSVTEYINALGKH